jgi:L-2-hydroxyglutarate oxidase LhgO
MMEVETLVVGAGVLGLAAARALARAGRETLVLEAEGQIGAHTSSHNSEVIHAGLYYPEASLKARACVAGRDMLYDYCASRGVAAKKIGKLIVATQDAQIPRLEALLRQGRANGVDDLVWLEPGEAARLEPEVRCRAAIHSPSTGIVDSAALMLALEADAENAGALFVFHSAVTRVTRRGEKFAVETEGAPPLLCRQLALCAGHGAQDIARATQDYPAAAIPPRFFAKGNYCSVSGRTPFSRLVYPLPVEGGLGVHVTLDLAGRMRLGPDLHWVEGVDYRPIAGVEAAFRDSVAQFWPEIREREIAASGCGVRPKISGPGEPAEDFRIDGPSVHGLPGLVACYGVESPGLTASLALAELIARELQA